MEQEAAPEVRGGKKKNEKLTTIVLVCVAALALLVITLFGWYQFSKKPHGAIELVRNHAVPGTGRTIGDSVKEFVEDKGVNVGSAFVPRWGAEEGDRNTYTVSYVYEEEYGGGREARWISWRVSLPSGEVTPLGGWARQLWDGKK